MSNPYFTFATPLTPGTRGRAGELNDLFLAVEAGFDAIPAVGSAPFGTPTVKVGLAPFDQGVSNFVLRADAKLVLDEAIAPTWTGYHKFTNASGIEIESTSPTFLLDETDAPTNERMWQIRASSGNLFFTVLNDLGGGAVDFAVVARTGTTVDSIALTSTALTWNGSALLTAAGISASDILTKLLTVDGSGSGVDADLLDGVQGSDYARLSQTNTFTSGNIFVSASGEADYWLHQSGAATNEKYWRQVATGGTLYFQTYNDALSSGVTWLQVDRTGTTVDAIALASTALTWNGTGVSTLGANVFTGTQTFGSTVTFSSASPGFRFTETDASANNKNWYFDANGEQLRFYMESDVFAPVNWMTVDRTANTCDAINFITTALTWGGNSLFTTANDGTGSGLDSDLLDGQHGSFYQSATNLNAGTVPDARFPATLPAASGVNLTALNATNLASGAVPAARMPAHTGDVTSSAGAVALTIANDAVTYAKMQNVSATSRILGRITAAAGDVEELTAANVKTILALAAGDISGLAAIATSGSASDLSSGTIPSARVTAVDAACTINAFVLGYVDVPRRTSGFAKGECLAVSAGQTLNTSDMATSRCFSLYNDSASTITLTQGAGVTLRKHGTATTGNLTVAIRGVVTIWCNSGTEAIATGDVS